MCNCIEEWKEIKGKKFSYYISSKGRLVSDYYYPPIFRKYNIFFHKDDIKKLRPRRRYGFNGGKKYLFANRLVGQYFLNDGKEIEEDLEVDHFDTNTLNDCVCNLEICTKKENMNNPNTRKNISKALTGLTKSKEHRRKMSINSSKLKNYKKGEIKKRGNKWVFRYRLNKVRTAKSFNTKEEAEIAQKVYIGVYQILEKYYC